MAEPASIGNSKGEQRSRAARALQAISDASLLFIVLLLSALTVAAVAVAAPIALAVSALAGRLFPPHERRRWRDLRAA
ncbi:MAG: hypothetical protein GC153_08115 [Alphaproteobacteria bacterium]|nr:hypothetical protein [Alphaproteobacteria bacterium]